MRISRLCTVNTTIVRNRRIYFVNSRFVECDNEEELISYVAETEWKGYTVMSVTKICADGSRPRVAVKSTPAYMRAIRKLLS